MSSATSKHIRVCIGWDHAVSPAVHEALRASLAAHSAVSQVIHAGPPDTSQRVDYPDVAAQICTAVLSRDAAAALPDGAPAATIVGVLVCGTGIGMSIAANKFPGIRAALCHDAYTAEMARRHNDANVLCMGARTTGIDVLQQILHIFLATPSEGGRHATRVEKIAALEHACSKASGALKPAAVLP